MKAPDCDIPKCGKPFFIITNLKPQLKNYMKTLLETTTENSVFRL